MIKNVYIETLLIALPMKVAAKNTVNGICRWPHVRPAKSNNGLGIEAARVTVMNAFFLTCLNNASFILLSVSVAC